LYQLINAVMLLLHSNFTQNMVLLAGFNTIYRYHSLCAYFFGPPCICNQPH